MRGKLTKFFTVLLTFLLVVGMMPMTGTAYAAASSDVIQLTKTAKDKGTDTDGNQIFDITLGVKGDKATTTRPIDVTLVIDVSGSMGDSSKMTNTKTAAKSFVDNVLKEGSQARISVVQFATDASAAQFNNDGSYKNYDTSTGNNYSSSADGVKSAIDQLSANGGTNTEAGAVMAKKVTDNRNRAGVDSIVIFLTDGNPTYYSNGGTSKAGGLGSATDTTTFNKAVSALEALKKGNQLYSIGFLTAYLTTSSEYKICEALLSDKAYNTADISVGGSGTKYNPYYYKSVSFTPQTDKSANFTKYYPIKKGDNAASKINSIYNELSTIVNAYAKGTVVDKIPADFELTDAAIAAIDADPNASYDPATRTVTYINVEAGENEKTNTFEIKYTGNGYGAAYTNTEATYSGKLYDNTEFSKTFVQPVAGLHPKTVDDSDSTTVNTSITVDIRKNDPFEKFTVDGYEVSDYTIVLTDANGNPVNYTGDFTATIVDGQLQFTSKTEGTKELYYVVKANITKEGANFAIDGQKELKSRPTKVTIDVYNAPNKAFVIDFGKPVTYKANQVFSTSELNAQSINLNNSNGTYGDLTFNGDKSITYTLHQFMSGFDKFIFNEKFNDKVTVEKSVSMVPASNIYYEDNFTDKEGNTLINYGTGWQVLGTDNIPGVNGDGNLGYDSAYDTSDSELSYSGGTIHYVPKSKTSVKANFTFTGQGIDLYSYTSGATGKLTFRVFDESGTRVFNKTINTKYNSGEAYQVPAVTFMGEKSQTYRVEITVPKNEAFYLDAIRIYNSVQINKDEIGGVDIDNEADAKFVSIREESLNPTLFTVSGNVFIDKYANNDAKVVTIADSLSEYTTYGRKSEVVLAPNGSITITLNNLNKKYSKVELGARIDAAVPSNITGGSEDGKLDVNGNLISLKSSIDMYYAVSFNNQGQLVITNNTNKLVALTKLKLID